VSPGRLQFRSAGMLPVLFFLGLSLYLITAVVNIGFIAIDDYDSSIAPVIPAQRHSGQEIIQMADFRSPLPGLTLHNLARIAWKLGLEDPASQFRFVLAVLALFSFVCNALFSIAHFNNAKGEDVHLQKLVVTFLLGFFFLCPLFLTRPLIEALSAPFLTGSAYFACAYWLFARKKDLVFSIVLLSVASMYRFQVGVCLIAILATVLWKRRWWDLIGFFAVAAVCFLVTGDIDAHWKGSFHASVRSYLQYNLHYSSTFGTTPFYTFLLLFLGLTLPPTFLSRYRGFKVRAAYRDLIPTVLFFVVFVAAHSIVPHKEERFMVPVLPIFLILLTPLAVFLLKASASPWRAIYFLTINFLLLILTSFNIPQNNIVGMARYLHRHPEIGRVVGVEDTLVLFPTAFILHPVEEGKVSLKDLPGLSLAGCHSMVAIRADLAREAANSLVRYRKVTEFHPGFLERLIVKWNPKNNARRGAIELWAPIQCDGKDLSE
jgi:Alg9-like mannosyltransferase family